MSNKPPAIYTFNEVVGSLDVKDKGSRWEMICPFHDDKTASLSIYKPGEKSETGFYKCFACGSKGDLVGWLIQKEGMTMPQAMAKVYGDGGRKTKTKPPPKGAAAKSKNEEEPWIKRNAPKKHRAKHDYFNLDGVVTHTVFRMPISKSGAKTLSYEIVDGKLLMVKNEEGWGSWGEPGTWPLYGLYQLRERVETAKSVIVVCGEGDTDYTLKMLPNPTVTFPAGDNNVLSADWSPVIKSGKPVILVPDNDVPGRRAMLTLANHLHSQGVPKDRIYLIRMPEHLPKGWDLQDSKFKADELKDFLNAHREPWDPAEDPPPLNEAKPPEPPRNDPPPPPPQESLPPPSQEGAVTTLPGESLRERVDSDTNPYFRIIGLERVQEKGMRIWVYMKTEHTYQVLASDSITWGKILDLAPLEWWAMLLGTEGKIARTDQSQTIPNLIRDIARRKAAA